MNPDRPTGGTVMVGIEGGFEHVVGPEHYFAMGDNSRNSWDSRNWGDIPEQNAVGRGVFVWWPFGPHWGFVK
jgi:signal peptidase I